MHLRIPSAVDFGVKVRGDRREGMARGLAHSCVSDILLRSPCAQGSCEMDQLPGTDPLDASTRFNLVF